MTDDYYSVKDRISNSMLNWLEVSPSYFLTQLHKQEKATPAMELGTVVHKYVEDPAAFKVADVIKPPEKMEELVNFYLQFKEMKAKEPFVEAFKASQYDSKMQKSTYTRFSSKEVVNYMKFIQESKDSLVLTRPQHNTVRRVKEALGNHEFAKKLLRFEGPIGNEVIHNEMDVFWDYKLSKDKIVKCKSKLDKVIVGESTIDVIDFKTTSESPYGKMFKIGESGYAPADFYATGFLRSYLNYKYYRQKYFYTEAVKQSMDIEGKEVVFWFVVVNTTTNYDICIYKVSNSNINLNYAKPEIEALLHKYYDLFVACIPEKQRAEELII